jgi:acyl carrier protein
MDTIEISLPTFLTFVENELGFDKNEISSNQHFRESRLWSSINALFLMTRMAEEWGFILSASELASCSTFEDIYLTLVAKKDGI